MAYFQLHRIGKGKMLNKKYFIIIYFFRGIQSAFAIFRGFWSIGYTLNLNVCIFKSPDGPV